ncbi:hypothetical protein J6590_079567 [Homalodisca vitripennis]|nr:hypothetical protein J6590_079567 [Homalodisca vitripennis]
MNQVLGTGPVRVRSRDAVLEVLRKRRGAIMAPPLTPHRHKSQRCRVLNVESSMSPASRTAPINLARLGSDYRSRRISLLVNGFAAVNGLFVLLNAIRTYFYIIDSSWRPCCTRKHGKV